MKKKIISTGCLALVLICLFFLGSASGSSEEQPPEQNTDEIAWIRLEDRTEERERVLDRNRDAEAFESCLELLEGISETDVPADARYTLTVFYRDKGTESQIYRLNEKDGQAEVLRELLEPGWITL